MRFPNNVFMFFVTSGEVCNTKDGKAKVVLYERDGKVWMNQNQFIPTNMQTAEQNAFGN